MIKGKKIRRSGEKRQRDVAIDCQFEKGALNFYVLAYPEQFHNDVCIEVQTQKTSLSWSIFASGAATSKRRQVADVTSVIQKLTT